MVDYQNPYRFIDDEDIVAASPGSMDEYSPGENGSPDKAAPQPDVGAEYSGESFAGRARPEVSTPTKGIPECTCGGKVDGMHGKSCAYRAWWEENHVPGSANLIQIDGDHYKEKAAIPCPHCGKKLEHWDLSWAAGWDMFQYCITKYVFRWKYKNGLNDLRKAQHYLQKYIEILEKEAQL